MMRFFRDLFEVILETQVLSKSFPINMSELLSFMFYEHWSNFCEFHS